MHEPKSIEGYEFSRPDPFDVESGLFQKHEGMWHPQWELAPKDVFDLRHLICKCGSCSFKVFFPQAYHTAVQCTACGNQETVHTG
jgi:hypothetical protein